MNELLEMLEEICPDVDFESCDTLVDDGFLDSVAVCSIASELQDSYNITITSVDLTPENFNSADAIYEMIQKLKEE